MQNETLLISVGGAHPPIIFSIRSNRPARVIFFVSSVSRNMVCEKILPELLKDPGYLPDHEFIVTPNEQDLGESTLALQQEIPCALRRLGVTDSPWPSLVDYTAGTKTMSAAVVWASSRYPCRFSYIGTRKVEGRNKDGLGTVIDGMECRFLQENPWDRVAWLAARDALVLFNRGQYANAASMLTQIAAKVTDPPAMQLFQVLAEIFQGFHAWDTFDHQKALRCFGKHRNTLQALAETPQVLIPGMKPFRLAVEELWKVLDIIPPGKPSREIAYDLLANALRRAELEQKYEDATARLYAALEKFLHYELFSRYGVDSSNADIQRLPLFLREEYQRKYTNSQGKVQFGLVAKLELLKAFGDDIGRRLAEREEKAFRSHLTRRNESILGHGIVPMGPKDFEQLFVDCLQLMKLEKESLTSFPTFPL